MKDDMKLEMQAGSNIQLDHIKKIMKENIPDLLAENQRLKAQLDREIHINRKMKKALEKYVEVGYLEVLPRPKLVCDNPCIDMGLFAREALKQIEEME